MVKSADTADLKSADPYQVVGVQVPLRAPSYNYAMWSNLFTLMNALDTLFPRVFGVIV
jgi:hypothetical protein